MAKCDFCFRPAEYEVKVFGAGWSYVCYIHYANRESGSGVTKL